MKKNPLPGLLRIMALVLATAGGLGSFGLMLRMGRHNHSVLLLILFGIWVLSPFMAVVAAIVVSNRRPIFTRIILCSLALILTLGSLVSYSGLLSPPGVKPAGVFLIVPLLSWVLIAIVTRMAASQLRKLSAK